MGQLLDGKEIAAEIRNDLQEEIIALKRQGITPKLVVVLVGEDPASASYVRSKERMADKLGLVGEVRRFPDTVTEQRLLEELELLNADDEVDAILVQLPLPYHIDKERVLASVRPDKDVDGFHPMNVGRYASGLPLVWPCTPSGILQMLQRRNIEIAGRTAVVVGRSQIVGWPTAQLLLSRDATVIQCHRQTVGLSTYTRQADILVVAAGQPGLITADDVKEGAVVIDVGINRVDGKLVGDVDFHQVLPKAFAITPVPGGVGPLTVTMLMYNTVWLCYRRRGGID